MGFKRSLKSHKLAFIKPAETLMHTTDLISDVLSKLIRKTIALRMMELEVLTSFGLQKYIISAAHYFNFYLHLHLSHLESQQLEAKIA